MTRKDKTEILGKRLTFFSRFKLFIFPFYITHFFFMLLHSKSIFITNSGDEMPHNKEQCNYKVHYKQFFIPIYTLLV